MTEALSLSASSQDEQVDRIAAGVVGVLETHFPGRIRGCSFEGSCADGGLTPLSDIDLCVVFAGAQTEAELHGFATLGAALNRISPRGLDLSCIDEATLLRADQLRFGRDWQSVLGAISLKCASLPIYGADIRDAIPFVPHDVYRRTVMHIPFLVLAGQRGSPTLLPYPLSYPDPTDPFFGYTSRNLRGPDGTLVPSTKRLVHASGFIATALVALRTSLYVADKRTAITAYRQHIGDAWSTHLEAIHQHCRLAWGYRVPQTPADQALLRELCRDELVFENHFLAIYRDYLLQEQHSDDEHAREVARERLRQMSA
jgi:hypothetical protein